MVTQQLYEHTCETTLTWRCGLLEGIKVALLRTLDGRHCAWLIALGIQ